MDVVEKILEKKIKSLRDLASSSIFFPFTEPTVRSPTGRLIKGHMPALIKKR